MTRVLFEPGQARLHVVGLTDKLIVFTQCPRSSGSCGPHQAFPPRGSGRYGLHQGLQNLHLEVVKKSIEIYKIYIFKFQEEHQTLQDLHLQVVKKSIKTYYIL